LSRIKKQPKQSLQLVLQDYKDIFNYVVDQEDPESLLCQKIKKKIDQLENPPERKIIERVKYKCSKCDKEWKRAVFKCKECDNSDLKTIKLTEFL
jgi:hypothetical protein